MKAKLVVLFVAIAIVALTGCGNASGKAAPEAADASNAGLADGVYSADFITDGSMFHVNEANDGKGVLTVEGGR